jgi:hypothetical protein
MEYWVHLHSARFRIALNQSETDSAGPNIQISWAEHQTEYNEKTVKIDSLA